MSECTAHVLANALLRSSLAPLPPDSHPPPPPPSALSLLAACVAAVFTRPPPHPYLLADNRHFTFYIWRRLLAPQWAAAAVLLPCCTLCCMGLVWRLRQLQSPMWLVGFLACLAATLVPAWLLELRCECHRGGGGGLAVKGAAAMMARLPASLPSSCLYAILAQAPPPTTHTHTRHSLTFPLPLFPYPLLCTPLLPTPPFS